MANRRLPGTTQGQHDFARIPRSHVPRSVFNRSCGMKTTLNFGEITPIFIDEALPGDTMQMNPTIFARLANQIVPVVDNMYIDLHWWAVPNRIVWDNWQKFCGEQIDPDDSTDYEVPIVTATAGFATNGFYDHIGIPPGINIPSIPGISNLYGRAMNKIWNEWYRDENLQDSITVDTDDGPDDPADYDVLHPRGKRHDYFTSCLPWPQKGEAVELPIGTSAVVTMDAGQTAAATGTGPPTFDEIGGVTNRNIMTDNFSPQEHVKISGVGAIGNVNLTWNDPQLETDIAGLTGIANLSTAIGATINQLRQNISIQRLYEKDARGGTRYKEVILSHFGVSIPDSRLQRPEYLGGGTVPIGVNQVAQQSGFGKIGGPHEHLGALGAWASAVKSGNGFSKTFDEHSVIIGVISARADLNYQQGIERTHSRRTRWDFYWPELSNLGEQSVLSKEIFADGSATDETVFGYQTRFAEYRYKPSSISGIFRSSHASSIDIWHLAQEFNPRPTLSASFIEENPPIGRILATPNTFGSAELLADMYFEYRSVRPMPQYGVPGLTRL